MVKRRFICTNCGHKFVVDVFEEGEAKEKGMPSGPIRCPKCSGAVERN
jgi:DNA-directed RNA polymerase subunit RPC12/RpoP